MDIVAKHIPADKDGVRIAELDEQSYRYLDVSTQIYKTYLKYVSPGQLLYP